MAKDTYLELGVQADFKELDKTGARGCFWLQVAGAIALGVPYSKGLTSSKMGQCWWFWMGFGDGLTHPTIAKTFTFLNEKL
jgi:hypothetical protein